MTDFLLELRCEEIPARMQAGARADLARLFREHMAAAGVTHGEVTVWSTPRRLALIARGLPQATEAVREELKGPRTSAPPQAVEGFLRKTGLTQDQLETRGDTYFAVIERPGRATPEVLAWATVAIVRAFPWPKSMRWGAASLSTEGPRWVRPLSGIVAIFGDALVDCEVGDVASGYMTLGHRFHHAGPITIGGAADYQEKLRACHVIVDHEERQNLIRIGATKAAADAGLTLVADEGLVIENAGLTEWPVPLLGRFDPDFLEVPPEVIQLTARVNQKYFVCQKPSPLQGRGLGEGNVATASDRPRPQTPSPGSEAVPQGQREGELADAFVCTANIDPHDGGAAIVDGNRKVLAARLSDARFFWDQDRKTPLAEHAKKLERITFHEKLGSVAYRARRASGFAIYALRQGWLCGFSEEEIELTSVLAKADLVTAMVGEFPELQGVMGSYYARAEGLPDAVVEAIRDQYKPVGPSDDVPTNNLAVAVALSDKMQALCGFFGEGILPTGSRDPFALRRAALGVIRTILENNIRMPLRQAIQIEMTAIFFAQVRIHAEKEELEAEEAIESVREFLANAQAAKEKIKDQRYQNLVDEILPKFAVARLAGEKLLDFVIDRLKVQQREAGVRHDLIDAVFALGGEDDLVRLLARVHALQSFIATPDGANLLAGYKRAANILKKEDWQGIEGEIARTGEEDPLAQVDDPDVAPVIAAKMAERHEKELSYTPEPAEKELIDALDAAGPDAAAAIEAEDFGGAMRALASLRAPIDRFFDSVTVNDDDPLKRAARLDLLARFRDAVHRVADFARIEG